MATKRKTGKATARRAATRSARKPARKAAAKARGAAARRKRAGGAARAARKATSGLSLNSTTPGFTVNDIQKSIEFYRDVLGFEVKELWKHDGVLGGAEMTAGRMNLYLGQDDWKKGRDRVKGVGFRIYCETTQDLDAIVAWIKAHGGMLAEELESRPWGSRDFAVTDPDGFKITISSPIR
jgi:uncharacterized glyoxalase superfamily protein PhnB